MREKKEEVGLSLIVADKSLRLRFRSSLRSVFFLFSYTSKRVFVVPLTGLGGNRMVSFVPAVSFVVFSLALINDIPCVVVINAELFPLDKPPASPMCSFSYESVI